MPRRPSVRSLVATLVALTLAAGGCSPTRGTAPVSNPVSAPVAPVPAAPAGPADGGHRLPPEGGQAASDPWRAVISACSPQAYPQGAPATPDSPSRAAASGALSTAAAAMAEVLAAPDPIALAPSLAAALDRAAATLDEAATTAAAAAPSEAAPLLPACARVLSSAAAAVTATGDLDTEALPAALLALRRHGEVAAAVAADTAAIQHRAGPAATAPDAAPVMSLADAVAARLEAAVAEALARLRERYLEPLPGDRVAYLTFDDGPGAQTTPRILDVLAEQGVPATFFVVGAHAAEHPDLIRRMRAEGHAVGNHTYNHHYPDIYPEPGQFLDSLAQTDRVLAPLLGEGTRLVRAPGGSYNKFTRRHLWLLEAAGYVAFDWNVDSEDAKGATTAAAIAARVTETVGDKPVAVILLHDANGKGATVEALPGIIAYLREQGYGFAALDPGGPGLSQAAGRLLAAPPPAGP